MLLKPGRRESIPTPHPAPLRKEGGYSYETHHTVVGYHGSDPVGGKRGGTGGGDRLRRHSNTLRKNPNRFRSDTQELTLFLVDRESEGAYAVRKIKISKTRFQKA